jgi:hypothetical protein
MDIKELLVRTFDYTHSTQSIGKEQGTLDGLLADNKHEEALALLALTTDKVHNRRTFLNWLDEAIVQMGNFGVSQKIPDEVLTQMGIEYQALSSTDLVKAGAEIGVERSESIRDMSVKQAKDLRVFWQLLPDNEKAESPEAAFGYWHSNEIDSETLKTGKTRDGVFKTMLDKVNNRSRRVRFRERVEQFLAEYSIGLQKTLPLDLDITMTHENFSQVLHDLNTIPEYEGKTMEEMLDMIHTPKKRT